LSDTLAEIKTFRAALRNVASSDDANELWDRVLLIESSLAFDPRHSTNEKKIVRSLRRATTDLIVAYRDALTPHTSPILVELIALESSIEQRTIGPDGWPLKK